VADATGAAGDAPASVAVGVAGHLGDDDTPPDPSAIERIALPEAFRVQLEPLILPGTSLVVTDTAILEQTTGAPMTALTSPPEA
jgi:hypothetical protein